MLSQSNSYEAISSLSPSTCGAQTSSQCNKSGKPSLGPLPISLSSWWGADCRHQTADFFHHTGFHRTPKISQLTKRKPTISIGNHNRLIQEGSRGCSSYTNICFLTCTHINLLLWNHNDQWGFTVGPQVLLYGAVLPTDGCWRHGQSRGTYGRLTEWREHTSRNKEQ